MVVDVLGRLPVQVMAVVRTHVPSGRQAVLVGSHLLLSGGVCPGEDDPV